MKILPPAGNLRAVSDVCCVRWWVGVHSRRPIECRGIQELLARGGELVPVVFTRVDALVTHRFRPEASARLSDEVLVAYLVLVPTLLVRDLYYHHLSVSRTRPGPASPR